MILREEKFKRMSRLHKINFKKMKYMSNTGKRTRKSCPSRSGEAIEEKFQSLQGDTKKAFRSKLHGDKDGYSNGYEKRDEKQQIPEIKDGFGC